ncbi:lactose/cellobiose PTS transporter subunit IIB [Aerococcus tenax]|uniref:lactose/cellobiose PTS transporter subunit IIB n=1 Tax=Aerococcus tenax TaxID=3078812 RepID=UPI00398E36C8
MAEEVAGGTDNNDQTIDSRTTSEVVEEEIDEDSLDSDTTQTDKLKETKNVLVLCAGGGTSGLLANALKKGAAKYGEPIDATAGAYGSHLDIMPDFDLVVLAPQVASNYEDIKKDADRMNVKLVKTDGKEYISLTNDPKGALEFVKKQFRDED